MNELLLKEEHWTADQIQLLKNTVCKDTTDDEFKLFCYAVKRTGLDPFMKQIHAVKRWNAKNNRNEMNIQVGIDGYRLIADRTGHYAGNDEAIFDSETLPQRATVSVYKMVQGQRCAFTATARWVEYYPGDKLGFMWKKMPCVMLAKVAESLALRKAFPAELSGVYVDEEMEQAAASRVEKEVSSQLEENKPYLDIKPPFKLIESDKAVLIQIAKTHGHTSKEIADYLNFKGKSFLRLNEEEYQEIVGHFSKFKDQPELEKDLEAFKANVSELGPMPTSGGTHGERK